MVNKSSSHAPHGNLRASSTLFRLSLFEKSSGIVSLAFALLCLVLSGATVSAQTRPTRATVEPEERSRRIDDNRAGANVSGQPNNARQAERPPLVRKTVLTYPSNAGNQSVERPMLTNDFVIVSEASPAAIARSNAAVAKAGSAASSIPSIWPVLGPLRSGVGVRRNPFGGAALEFHKGQDISAPTGTPVSATADGVVVIARWVHGYGNGIYIDHGNGISTRYGHLSRIDVVEGQTVKRGQYLGLVGSTGRSTGPHLHYEVRINGQPVSPLPYLPAIAPTPAAQQSLQR